MVKIVKNVFSKRNKVLLGEMIRTDFKLRYQNSVLGYLWSLLKPLMLFAILYTVFTQFLRIGRGVPNYPISLLLGIVLWNFFAEASAGALKSIVGKGNLIRKINIPRYLIPIASISSAFINTLLNLIVVFVFVMFAQNTPLSWATLLVLPVLLLELIIISVATGFFLAALYVKYRDIEHIWDIVRQALFYTIPIIYPLSYIPSEKIQQAIMLNPLAQIIQDARSVVTYGGTEQLYDLYDNPVFIAIPFVLIVIALLVSSTYFRKRSKYFAEDI
jgi:ABC-2 type transport system permease protein